MKMDKPMFETTDLFRGAFHLCHGAYLCGVRISQQKSRLRGTFQIQGTLALHRLDKLYREGLAVVNPLELREALNLLRDALFDELRKQEGRCDDDRSRHHRADQA